MAAANNNDLVTILGRMRDKSPEMHAELERKKPRRELADSFVQMRLSAGLTQKQLAQRMGRNQAFISRLESSVGPVPDADTIACYANACGFAGGYLFVERDHADQIMQVVNLNDDAQDEALLAHALSKQHRIVAG